MIVKHVALDAICRFDGLQHAKWTVLEVKKTIHCVVSKWPVPGGYLKAAAIAYRESKFAWWAYNPSGACGIYQHLMSYWPGRENTYDKNLGLGESCYNARSNIIVAVRMVHASGWGPWGG